MADLTYQIQQLQKRQEHEDAKYGFIILASIAAAALITTSVVIYEARTQNALEAREQVDPNSISRVVTNFNTLGSAENTRTYTIGQDYCGQQQSGFVAVGKNKATDCSQYRRK